MLTNKTPPMNTPAQLRKHIDALIAQRKQLALTDHNDERIDDLTHIIDTLEDLFIDAVNKQNASK